MRDTRSGVIAASIAVFALALGVILGSGPLRTALVGQTGSEADRLRAQIDLKVAQLAQQQADADALKAQFDQLAPVLLASRLDGQQVLLITTPDADPVLVENLTDALIRAGATVALEASLGSDWFAPESAAFRSAFADEIRSNVVGLTPEAPQDEVLRSALAQALVPNVFPDGISAPPPLDQELPESTNATDRADLLLDLLGRAGLVHMAVSSGEADTSARAQPTLAVFVAGFPEGGNPDSNGATALVRAAATLDLYTRATVIASPAHTSGDVADAVEGDRTALGAVSVVTDAGASLGPILVVLAAQEQVQGRAGVYVSGAIPVP